MKRWLGWFALPVLASLAILANRATGAFLLTDTDTSVLIAALRQRHDPWSWFRGDWPLQNHFYRPVSTLVFELDERLHPGSPAGFGLTNALLAAACVLLLFWVVRELAESPWLAGLSSGLFGLWHLSPTAVSVLEPVSWILAATTVVFLVRGVRSKLRTVVLGFFTLAFLATVWQPVSPFGDSVVSWLPGRTASTMTVFALLAMATYARYERLTAGRATPPPPSSTDLPATKGTEVVQGAKGAGLWLAISLAAVALALGSYEQAVMLPGVLVGCAVVSVTQGRRPHWWAHAGFWGLLVVYVAVRAKFVPTSVSGYQDQQFRNGPGVLIALMDYAFPAWNWGRMLVTTLGTGLILLMTAGPWVLATLVTGNVVSWWAVAEDRSRWTVVGWFALSVVAFLPMAWLQPFGHYHYWPSALRAVYVVGLAAVAGKAWSSAAAPPTLRAPLRPRPAPGSLPRP